MFELDEIIFPLIECVALSTYRDPFSRAALGKKNVRSVSKIESEDKAS